MFISKHKFDISDIIEFNGRISVIRQLKSLVITEPASNDLKIAKLELCVRNVFTLFCH